MTDDIFVPFVHYDVHIFPFLFVTDRTMSDQPAINGLIPPPVSEPNKVAASSTETKPKKRICCACPDTKKLRDECIVEHGESACTKWIEAHKMCLRAEGFNV
ncbi:unnamed protein product [Arabis nemorensis]|uniref:Cytochrome c oxidase copper chaperone n=1 Tax=Arabis nemorensis TaxID=586526 RepID=A0A565B8P4_9BRAS|nr:unnamed protein product [Arabis nemorensis]